MKTLFGILLLAVIAFGGAYLVSDPFRTKVDSIFRSATTWTDENIAKNPEGYLQWALAEFDQLEDALRGRRVGLRTQLNSLQRKQQAEADQSRTVQERLQDLKSTYRSASDTDGFPVTLNGLRADEDELRQLIIEADQRLELYARNARHYELALPRTEADLQRVESALEALRDRRGEVTRQLQQVQVDAALSNIEGIDDRINALLDSTRSIASEAEQTLRLDDVLIENPSDLDRRRFEEIMRRE